MMRVTLTLLCAAVAASYPTDNPVSEPQSRQLALPDDVDNIGTEGDGCCFENLSPVPTTRNEDEDELAMRLGRGGRVGPAPEEKEGRSNDNFVRFGRGGRTGNFVRLGRGDKQDHFIRFGRDMSDNFGRQRTGNFIRFGRGQSDSFIRFGRGQQDNFIRFGRDKQGNFIRFGREMKRTNDQDETFDPEDTNVNFENEFSTGSKFRVGRGGKSDSNFIRFGRARPSNFIRLGRGNGDLTHPEERGKASSKIVRFGRQTYDDNFVRLGRSSDNNDAMRRGKLTDRNFIRLGRSGQPALQYDEIREVENAETLGRADNPVNHDFIRLGKRAEDGCEHENFVRSGRDVEHILSGDNENTTDKHIRSRRSVTLSGDDETPEDSSDYPTAISNSAYDGDKVSAAFEDSEIPFRYYSPLTSGIANYILGPELEVLAPLSKGAVTKGRKGAWHNRNYIRLG
jgi:hypothetical protein